MKTVIKNTNRPLTSHIDYNFSFTHPLKNYTFTSFCIYVHRNLEFIIFIVLALALVIYIAYRAKENFENADQPHGINQMDGIIYINLEDRTDRKDLLLKELTALDTDMTKVHKVNGVYIPKNGHKGCVQAHILALKLAQLNKWDPVLILEDDAQLSVSPSDFNETVYAALEKLSTSNTKWDVIMLASANKVYSHKYSHKNSHKNSHEIADLTFTIDSKPSSSDTEISSDISSTPLTPLAPLTQTSKKTITLKKLKSATTSSAYIVHQNYIKTILNLFKNCNANMSHNKLNGDNFEYQALDQQWASLQGRDNWFAFDEDIIKQREIWSTILKSHAA